MIEKIAPVALLGVDLALIARGTHGLPLRQLWQLVGFGMVYAAAWWVLSHVAAPGRRIAWLAALSAACVPAAAAISPADVAMERLEFANAGAGSDLLWPVALPGGARIARFQPVLDTSTPLEVHVRLAGPYEGVARLHAAVNGSDLGALSFPPETEADQVEAVIAVPAGVLRCGRPAPTPGTGNRGAIRPAPPARDRDNACSRTVPVALPPASWRGATDLSVAEMVLWQDVEDAGLRIVAQRPYGGAALGADNSWFFDGEAWRRGVLHTATGRLTTGMWHIFLARGHVGR